MILVFSEYDLLPGSPLDELLTYIFSTPTRLLPDKLQRARQALENKETAFLVFRACNISVMELVSTAPYCGELVDNYFYISKNISSCKNRKRPITNSNKITNREMKSIRNNDGFINEYQMKKVMRYDPMTSIFPHPNTIQSSSNHVMLNYESNYFAIHKGCKAI